MLLNHSLFIKVGLVGLSLALPLTSSATGLGFDQTRVIIEKGKTAGSLVIDNRGNNAFFVRAHVEDRHHVKTSVAMARPPVFQLNAQKASRIQVAVDRKAVPDDRESLFWLYTKAYPAQKVDDGKNKLMFNFVTQLKVFYRPEGLSGNLSSAAKSLQWSVKGGQIVAKNDSPYNISMASYQLGKRLIDTNHVVEPFSSLPTGVMVKNRPIRFAWTIINDFGGAETYETELK